jgi:hypothetical protein
MFSLTLFAQYADMCLYESCNKSHMGKYLFDSFSINNGMKKEKALSL